MLAEPHLGQRTMLPVCDALLFCCCSWALNWDIFKLYSMISFSFRSIMASKNELSGEIFLIIINSSCDIPVSISSPPQFLCILASGEHEPPYFPHLLQIFNTVSKSKPSVIKLYFNNTTTYNELEVHVNNISCCLHSTKIIKVLA